VVRRRLLRRTLSSVLIALLVAGLAAAGLAAGAFGGFQRRAADSLLPSSQTDPRVVVVGMDQASINSELGLPPWPRSVQGELGRALEEAGAAAVVWDVLFLGATEPEADAALAAALEDITAPVLGAEVANFEPGPDNLYVADDIGGPEELATVGNTTIGHVLVTPDPADGVVRTVPLVVEHDGELVPSLSLQALRALAGEENQPVTIRPDGVQAGGRFIPTDDNHLLRLNFASGLESSTAPSVVSAIDVLEGRVSGLEGKVVFIGATDPVLGDVKLVPVDKSNTFPGVLVHANALNTMLTASYLTPVSDTQMTVWIALLALLVALAVLFLPLWLSPIVSLLVAAGYLVLSFVRFDDGHVMNLVYPFAAIVIAFVAALGVRYLTETRQRRRVSSLFAQYVPEAVASQLEESGHLDEHLDGERLDVSLFFCDLRGFTTISRTLDPSQVRRLLNAFYELTTDIILGQGGTILKFVGDEVFAVFGAPLPVEHHAQRALDCAVEIQRRGPELMEELLELDIPAIEFGIGLNTGDVVAAHVGSGRRRQYDIVGDTVNMASRLCGQAGRGEIVVMAAILDQFDDLPPIESLGPVALKGVDAPVELVKIVVEGAAAT
jgi:adenylate cyclase